MMMVGENQHHRQSSRLGLLRRCSRGGGEIVEVQGGHIVRSTGRKDRHSKVCTAKGPRDRRVRLSAHTAIQFYDVQDRLGYDRPSKAVDWLIDKAKTAIGQLAELPPWHPIETQSLEHDQEESEAFDDSSNKRPMDDEPEANNSSSFLPPSLDSDAIAKTIKSFFPMAANATSSSSINFQNFPSDQTQDLCLSLQSFQEPILLHQHSSTSTTTSAQQALFSSSIPMACDATWNAGIDTSGGGGFVFNPPPQPPMFLGQNPLFSQRGPLQSSNSPLFRAWMDPIASTTTNHHHHHHQMPMLYQSSISGIGFHIPARIQGEDEQDAASSNPSSASRH